MEKRELICIGCPMGCMMTVELNDGEILSVSGNTCKRGDIYARKEVLSPTRIVTSTIRVTAGEHERVPCKTARDIPKEKIFDVMDQINRACVTAPVKLGDVLIENVCDTGVAVIATAHVKKL